MVCPIEPRLAARIGSDACAGLHAAHELVSDEGEPFRLVRRDVTPHNLLISINGHLKVTDFGVAETKGQAQTSRSRRHKGKARLRGTGISRRGPCGPALQRLFDGVHALSTSHGQAPFRCNA